MKTEVAATLLVLASSFPCTDATLYYPQSRSSLTVRGGAKRPKYDAAAQQARIDHVRHVLSQRLTDVLRGERQASFTKWASSQSELHVLSMHGAEQVDVDEMVYNHTETQLAKITADVQDTNTTFPSDILSLELVPHPELPSMFPGKPLHLIDDRPPNLLELCFRSIRLCFNFAPVLWTTWLAVLVPSFRQGIWYKWIASCLASSGPAFIKWGQWASTRNDMFPDALCVQLANLHNDAPAHGWKFTQSMMESSLGLPKGTLLEIFDSFEEKPVASGSIAQVHKAVLRNDVVHHGTLVAVKVRHPRVARLIDMDFRLMKTAAAIVDRLPALSWLHIRDSVEQFSHTMAAQAHLNVEGHHLEVLNHNFRAWKHVQFPYPFYASSSVIIETFQPGRIVTDILDVYDTMATQVAVEKGALTVEEVEDDYDEEGLDADNDEKLAGYQFVPMSLAKFIVTTGLSIYLKMLLMDNLMHADLHPGNIMLDLLWEGKAADTPPSTSKALVVPKENAHVKKRRLGVTLVDAGMVAQLTTEESTNFVGLLCSLGDGDGRLAAKFALRFSQDTKLNDEESQAFADDMVEVFRERCGGYGTNVDVGHVLRGVLGLIRKHQVRIDANYATLVVNCLCVESLAQRVCPTYNLLDAAKPLLLTYRPLCYRKGKLNENPTPTQRAVVRLKMPLAYYKKEMSDSGFFKRQARLIKKQLKEFENKLKR